MKKHAGTALVLGTLFAASAIGCAAGSSGSDSGVDDNDVTGTADQAMIAPMGPVSFNGCTALAQFNIQSSNQLSFLAVNSDNLQTQDVDLSLSSISSNGASQVASQAQNISNQMAHTLNQSSDVLNTTSTAATSDRTTRADSVTSVDQHQSSSQSSNSSFANSADASASHASSAQASTAQAANAMQDSLIAQNTAFSNIGDGGLWLGVSGNSSSSAQNQNATSSAASSSSNQSASLVDTASQHNSGSVSQSSAAQSDSSVVTQTSASTEDHQAATTAISNHTATSSLLDEAQSSVQDMSASTSSNTQAFTNLSQTQSQHFVLQVKMNNVNNSTLNNTLQIFAGGPGGVIGSAVFPVSFPGTCGIDP